MTKLELMSDAIHALAGLMDELFDDEDIQANLLIIDLRDLSVALKNIAVQEEALHGNEREK